MYGNSAKLDIQANLMNSPNRNPEGPSTQYLRTLVPDTIKSMVLGTRSLKYWVLGPSGGRGKV